MLRQKTHPLETRHARLSGSLTDHLASSDSFSRLADQAERLRRLQALLDAMLPISLAPAARVANLKRGKVVIHADSGAVAVKLRQLGPRLAAGFAQRGHEISGIEVRVQPGGRISPPKTKIPPKKLSLRAKRSLTSLAFGLPGDSPLKAAIERLLRSARS